MESNQNWKRTFAFIWTGQLFSTLSSSVVSFAVIFWLSVQTGSAEVLALATISSLMPQLVFGLFTGVLIDRWNRKLTMIVADLYIAAITMVMAILFYQGDVQVGLIYLLLALRSMGSAFHMPAMEASVPLLAPTSELMRVAGVNNMIFSVSTIGAPAIAAIFISALDMTWVLMFDVAGALIACTSLLFVKIPNPWDGKERAQSAAQTEFKRFFHELNVGLQEVIKRPGLMWMFIFTVFASLAMVPISTLFPLMTLDHFAGDTIKMSIVEIAWGVGMLSGGGLMSLPKFKFNNVMLINAMYVILGLTFAFSGILPAQGFNFFVAFTLIGGVAGAIFWGAFTVLLQTSLDSSVLGRVFSIHNSLIMIPAMFSLMATGYIADNIGITNAFIISGAMLIVIGLLSPLIPAIRKMGNLAKGFGMLFIMSIFV
ncbi:MAG: MFS transporter [Bacteroidetes bacterium GWF2_41_61]|nr:MAG: MFS transporter [Bacteroidetes bacterium GWE2_40_15]OFY30073.1 MAG: MFS transporter [Bacteroidetes bacterium GWF2_41_61]OFY91748.1 MAG: MFS transporter [Bacteroidetes bacterium RIFOXYA12_FULL_40_10]HBG23624.1 MFS transporter [Rikenellaceae bacterium]HBZ25010.1 MFS transporter [Rikenellaceae bacterium]